MPKSSVRKKIEHEIESIQLMMLIDPDSDSDSDLETHMLLLNHLLKKRYQAPRINNFHHPQYERQKLHLLPQLSFQQIFCTSLDSFMKLLEMIEDHPIFQNDSCNPQRDPAIQLSVALCRLGSNGNGAALHRLENLFSLGYGSIHLYTKRCMKAILGLRRSMLCWPTKDERIEISQVMQQEGFPGCIGFVDGTTIPLSQKPALDGNHYFDRKKRDSISVQLVCDNNKKFISLHAGLPGSCHDSYVFKRMRISQEPTKYFDQNQYLIADSAYASGTYVVPAFRQSSANDEDKINFNYHLAQSRVRIEHAIGILKG